MVEENNNKSGSGKGLLWSSSSGSRGNTHVDNAMLRQPTGIILSAIPQILMIAKLPDQILNLMPESARNALKEFAANIPTLEELLDKVGNKALSRSKNPDEINELLKQVGAIVNSLINKKPERVEQSIFIEGDNANDAARATNTLCDIIEVLKKAMKLISKEKDVRATEKDVRPTNNTPTSTSTPHRPSLS